MDPANLPFQANGLLASALLADVPGLGGYFSLVKIGLFAAMFVGWAYVCQWVDLDTDVVKTKREQWNVIVLSGGIAGLAVLLLMPWAGTMKFILGLAFWVLLSGGAVLAYVFHRNGRVMPAAKVLTAAHAKRLLGGDRERKAKVDKGKRIRLADADEKEVSPPEDPEAYEAYNVTQDLLFDLLWRRSTDVDMMVTKDQVRLVYRIDGVALEQENRVTPEDAERVILYLKGLAGLNVEERRRPQSGRVRAALLAATGTPPLIDVQTSGSTAGERLRLRIHTAAETSKRLGELGLGKRDLERIGALVKVQTGLVIISGIKQSGVTTTQYAVVRNHDAFRQNLHTLEKAPMLDLDNITQNKFTGAEGITYARHLQSVLRREPDVILVGECGDAETAQMACKAASQDRKIYLALEAKGVFEALERIRQWVGDPKLIAKALKGVVCQRLVRVLCPACRQAFRPDERLLKKLNLPGGENVEFHRPPPEPILDKKGNEIICQTCQGTGYVGQTAVFEIMVADETVTKLLAAGAPIERVRDQCRRARMHDLRRAGLQKVYDGVTSLDEILRALRFDSK